MRSNSAADRGTRFHASPCGCWHTPTLDQRASACNSDLNLRHQIEGTPQHVDLASKKTVRKRPRQVQPNAGPKWAFGSVLREARQGKGLSQEQLAAAAELDRSFISMVERGIQSPNITVLFKISEILNVPAAELIARTESAVRTRKGTKAPTLPTSIPPV